jgi:pimeloyl-ACP methyl ester carboxylesterase
VEQPVEFLSQGETVRGTLFRPDEAPDGPLPTVVMAGGWCYVKEIVLPHVARIVNLAGVQCLGFDYRGFGESEGRRRNHLDPWWQIEDYKNAITYLESRDDVDADAIGAFGISYSGGHVLILAATDPRVKAIVSTVPVVDGHANMRRAHGELRYRELDARILEDRRARYDGEGGYLPMTTTTPSEELATWPFPHTNKVFLELKETEAPRHEHFSTVESTENLINYTVFPFLGRILKTPVMMLVADGDNLTLWDLEIEAFNKVPSPTKELVIMSGISHMSIYSDRPDTNVAASHAGRWFGKHLAGLDRVEQLEAALAGVA